VTGDAPFLGKISALLPEATPGYRERLARRLLALAERASRGTPIPRELCIGGNGFGPDGLFASLEGSWDEGDETLVLEALGFWGSGDTEEGARRIVETSRILGSIECRRGTVLFFLWELEAALADLAS
jgi:hypothetical protein